MKTIYYTKMTMILGFCAFFSIALTSNAQSVYVPDGQVDDSNNQNVGINVTNPEAKLDINTDENTGGIRLLTHYSSAGSAGQGLSESISPYAFLLNNNETGTSTENVSTRALLTSSGKWFLGDFGGNTTSPYMLNTKGGGIGIFGSSGSEITLSIDGMYGHIFRWQSRNNTTNPRANNLTFAHGTSAPFFELTPDEKVVIGTTNAPGNHKLYIAGSAIAEEVVVKLQTNWPDYVFAPDYAMLTNAQLACLHCEKW
jgi:hypothetical protein